MSSEYHRELPQEEIEEQRILREIAREARSSNPLNDRVKVFVSRKQWGKPCEPRDVILVDFYGDGTFRQVKVDKDGHFERSDTFASELLGEMVDPNREPEEILREYLGY